MSNSIQICPTMAEFNSLKSTVSTVQTTANNALPKSGGDMTGVIRRKLNVTRGTVPSANAYSTLEFIDSNNVRLAEYEYGYLTDGSSRLNLFVLNDVAGDNAYGGMEIVKSRNVTTSTVMRYNANTGVLSGFKADVGTIAGLGTVYQATGSGHSLSAGIDTYTNGATVTLPAGKYMVFAMFTFNSSSNTSSRYACTVAIGPSGSVYNETRNRVHQTTNNWCQLVTFEILGFSASTAIYSKGSSDIARTGCGSYIRAIRIANY